MIARTTPEPIWAPSSAASRANSSWATRAASSCCAATRAASLYCWNCSSFKTLCIISAFVGAIWRFFNLAWWKCFHIKIISPGVDLYGTGEVVKRVDALSIACVATGVCCMEGFALGFSYEKPRPPCAEWKWSPSKVTKKGAQKKTKQNLKQP